MFSTLPRGRYFRRNVNTQPEGRQEEQQPEPGVDSTYGVRSINDWGEGSERPLGSDTKSETRVQDEVEEEGGSGAGVTTSPKPEMVEMESTPTNDRPALPSPIPTPPYDHASESTNEVHMSLYPTSPGRSRSRDRSPRSLNYPSLSRMQDFDSDTGLSEPSSPASFASMPSYISSHLSRTSSLAGEPRQSHIPLSSGLGIGGSEELVMPTMIIGLHPGQAASTSLGGGLRHGPGQDGVVKVVVLGSEDVVGDFIRDLGIKNGLEVEDLDKGRYSLIKGDEVLATLATGFSGEEVEHRVEAAYITLNGALHPDPSPEVQNHVLDLVAGYAAKSDWVHLVVALDGEESMLASLGDLVPLLSTKDLVDPTSTNEGNEVHDPTSSLHSPHAIPDITPMPGSEGLGYFPLPDSPLVSSSTSGLIDRFLSTIHTPHDIQKQSTDKFIAWRSARRDLGSSHTSISHESSIGSYEAAMPTVARAQGGGEWEANLSRRLAKRKQSTGVATSGLGDGPRAQAKSRRRSTVSKQKVAKQKERESEKQTCGPLFPLSTPREPASGSSVGLGISELVEKTFGGLRRRWKWGLVAAAAVALVVGWNWDWSLSPSMRAGPGM